MRFRISTSAIGPWLFACGCGIALVLAVWVRYQPAERVGNRVALRADSAFHLRMLAYMLRDGELPENDPLFHREPPRKLAQIYPPNLYLTTAALVKLIRIRDTELVEFALYFFLFNALCGAFPVAACGWLLWEVSGGKRFETFMGMMLCAIAAPLVLRSHAGIFRHETVAVGLLLAFTAILLHGIRYGGRPFWYCMAIFCVFVGMGYWRLFPILAAFIVLGILLVEFVSEDSYHLESMIDAAALAGLAAGAIYPFYRTNLPQAVLYCLPILSLPAVHRLVHRLRVSPWGDKLRLRKTAILVAATVLVLIGVLAVPAIRVRLLAAVNPEPLPLTSATLYGILVEELAPLPFREAFSADFFLYLPILLIAPLFRLSGHGEPNPLHRVAAILFLIFLTLTVFFVRFVFLAFPFLIVCVIPSLPACIEKLKRMRPGLFGWINAHALLALLLVPAMGFYLWEDHRLSKYLLEPDRDQLAAYAWLKWNVPPRENVISDWSHGFEIQTISEKRTVMDGYLEDPQNRARILEFLRALLSTDESDLVGFMREHQGNYLVLDRVYLLPICKRLNLPWQEWFEIRQHEQYTRLTLKPVEKRNNYLKCLFDPKSLRVLRIAFNSGNYIVLRKEPAD